MRTDIYRFAGEICTPDLTISPVIDRGIRTLSGAYTGDLGTRAIFMETLQPVLTESDQICFTDISEARTPDMAVLLDRFQDATGGISPGRPTVKYREIDPEAATEDLIGLSADDSAARLERFHRLTKLRPRTAPLSAGGPAEETKAIWGGDANKFQALVRLPETGALIRSFLHELGHCAMHKAGFARQVTTVVETPDDDSSWSTITNWIACTSGLSYMVEGGEWKGTILEEAVAEGLGTLANRKLGLAATQYDDEMRTTPEMVAPYLAGASHSGSAPAAVALELIARELDIPTERYFRMFVDYANAGVYDTDARQEIAETIYRGTRGRLMLHQIEELPYPLGYEASLALLWAVEDALDAPDHARYSELFYQAPKRSHHMPSPVVVGNSARQQGAYDRHNPSLNIHTRQ